MSDTRKTAPGSVRAAREPARLLRERHDHRQGSCDLPEVPNTWNIESWGTRCRWEFSTEFYVGRDGGCPCWMCHGGENLRDERRHVRHEGRKVSRQLVRVLNSGGEWEDIAW